MIPAGRGPQVRAVKPPEFRLSVTLTTGGSGGGWGAGYGCRTPLPSVSVLSFQILSLPAWSCYTRPGLRDPRQGRPSLSFSSGGGGMSLFWGSLSSWSPTSNSQAQTPRLPCGAKPDTLSSPTPLPQPHSCGSPGGPQPYPILRQAIHGQPVSLLLPPT